MLLRATSCSSNATSFYEYCTTYFVSSDSLSVTSNDKSGSKIMFIDRPDHGKSAIPIGMFMTAFESVLLFVCIRMPPMGRSVPIDSIKSMIRLICSGVARERASLILRRFKLKRTKTHARVAMPTAIPRQITVQTTL